LSLCNGIRLNRS